MSCGKFEAARKFWATPELVEKLFPFLDLESTFHLAQVHQLTRDILQGSFAWNKLIRRSRLQEGGDLRGNDGLLEEKVAAVKLLVAILKLMVDPKANMLDLLDTICKRALVSSSQSVTVSCPNHQDSHEVPFEEFLLLEEIEGAFGTSEQKAEVISSSGFWGPAELSLLSALSSRVARQEKKLTSLSLGYVFLESKEGVEALKTLMQDSSEAAVRTIHVRTPIGGEGWKAIAEGVRLHPGLRLNCVTVLKDDLDEASQEDIRVMWDALETDGRFVVVLGDFELSSNFERVSKGGTKGEAGWTRLTEIKEMSKEEWAAELELEDDGPAEEEGEGGEDADSALQDEDV